MLSEVFLSLVVTSGAGILMGIAKLCFKSKCKEVDLCCLKITRDTETEEKEAEFMTLHKPSGSSQEVEKSS